jgi:ABC-type cobalamin/Fe3+-siderophores transport system ATPase subunit
MDANSPWILWFGIFGSAASLIALTTTIPIIYQRFAYLISRKKFIVVGATGVGKSSLLRIMEGKLPPRAHVRTRGYQDIRNVNLNLGGSDNLCEDERLLNYCMVVLNRFDKLFSSLPKRKCHSDRWWSKISSEEYAIAVTMVVIGLILNLSAWSDLREKQRRLNALTIATYDLARELGTRDVVEREWHILGEMAFSRRDEAKFVHSLQFICFLGIHLGLAVVLIAI